MHFLRHFYGANGRACKILFYCFLLGAIFGKVIKRANFAKSIGQLIIKVIWDSKSFVLVVAGFYFDDCFSRYY